MIKGDPVTEDATKYRYDKIGNLFQVEAPGTPTRYMEPINGGEDVSLNR